MPKYLLFPLLVLCCITYVTCKSGPDRTPRYDENRHQLLEEDLVNCKGSIQFMPERKIKKIQQNLKVKNKEWDARYPGKSGASLWDAYVATAINPNSKLLQGAYSAWRSLISNPSDDHAKVLIQSIEDISGKDSKVIDDFLKKLIVSRNDMKEKFTREKLEYLDYLMFIQGKYCSLHKEIKVRYAQLKQWQREQKNFKTGTALWQVACQSKDIQNHSTYQEPSNQKTIALCFEVLDQWASENGSPYNISLEDIEVTIPNGLDKLGWILSDINIDKNDVLKQLNVYVKKVALKG